MQFTCTSLYLQQFLLGRLIQSPDFHSNLLSVVHRRLCAYSVLVIGLSPTVGCLTLLLIGDHTKIPSEKASMSINIG
jgi:hypothetical protein